MIVFDSDTNIIKDSDGNLKTRFLLLNWTSPLLFIMHYIIRPINLGRSVRDVKSRVRSCLWRRGLRASVKGWRCSLTFPVHFSSRNATGQEQGSPTDHVTHGPQAGLGRLLRESDGRGLSTNLDCMSDKSCFRMKFTVLGMIRNLNK